MDATERVEQRVDAILRGEVARRGEQILWRRRRAMRDEIEKARVLCGQARVEDPQLRSELVRACVRERRELEVLVGLDGFGVEPDHLEHGSGFVEPPGLGAQERADALRIAMQERVAPHVRIVDAAAFERRDDLHEALALA